MGTRNLTCVYIDGDFKVAQYGQWDGYPSGQGATIIELLTKANIETLKANVRASTWATLEQIKAAWEEAGADPDSDWVSLTVSDVFNKAHPEWSRDTAAEILELLEERPLELKDDREFGTDGLFCEWAYVIDFDNNTLEVYRGFNQKPGKDHGKFAGILTGVGASKEYTPVVLLKTYSLSDLPTVEQMMADCCPPDPDDV